MSIHDFNLFDQNITWAELKWNQLHILYLSNYVISNSLKDECHKTRKQCTAGHYVMNIITRKPLIENKLFYKICLVDKYFHPQALFV
jgi:hypothetical protein